MRWQHYDELEADFQQYYQLDVGSVKPARAARLLFQLPQGCRVFTKIEPAQQWGWKEMLLNKIEFALRRIEWQNANEGVKKTKQTEQPTIFMPSFMTKPDPDKEQVVMEVEDMRELLNRPRV